MVKSGRFASSVADTDYRQSLRDSRKAAGESEISELSGAGQSRATQGSPALLAQDGAGLFRPLVA
jgi:hypothetical protein